MKKGKNYTKENVLTGAQNKRLYRTDVENLQDTAASADNITQGGTDKMPMPSALAVEEAKEWVDNGSRL